METQIDIQYIQPTIYCPASPYITRSFRVLWSPVIIVQQQNEA